MPITHRDLLRSQQCLKMAWFDRFDPAPVIKDPYKKQASVRAKALARRYFGDGVEGALINALPDAERVYDVILESGEIRVRIDLLERSEEGWKAWFFKTASGIKEHHFHGARICGYLASEAGVKIERYGLLLIDTHYIFNEHLEPQGLFRTKDITRPVRRRLGGGAAIVDAYRTLNASKPPETSIGVWCQSPYVCDYKSRCWETVPSPSVFDLSRMSQRLKFDLYQKGKVTFPELKDAKELQHAQKRQIAAEIDGTSYIDVKAIQKFLNKATRPLQFLDFETFQLILPEFQGQRPYENTPFQFSLHILDDENQLTHHEFLAEPGSDPRALLAQTLAEVLEPSGTVIAYNAPFEKSVIARLSPFSPLLDAWRDAMEDSFLDLMEPFKSGAYYTKAMKGRHSMKTVLPALVPELRYEGMEVSHGGEAVEAYIALFIEPEHPNRQEIETSLLEYCRLDTLGMVKIWEVLERVAQEGNTAD